MKIKKKINVLGHDYQIVFVDADKLAPNRLGECEFPTRIIRLSKTIKDSPDMILVCLLHELKHAQQFESGMMQALEQQSAEMDADSFASFVISLKKQKVI